MVRKCYVWPLNLNRVRYSAVWLGRDIFPDTLMLMSHRHVVYVGRVSQTDELTTRVSEAWRQLMTLGDLQKR